MSFNTAALAATVLVAGAPPINLERSNPIPVVMVKEYSIPKKVPKELRKEEVEASEQHTKSKTIHTATKIYIKLKSEFDISHTEMSKWLGVTRRSFYNWKENPEKGTKINSRIEERLSSLEQLYNEMEPEHHSLLFKIAFSPIYGDQNFGQAILSGASSNDLVQWYDSLFSKFESYRLVLASKQKIA